MCSTGDDAQYGGGFSVQRSTPSVQKRHTFSAEEDVPYGSVTSSVRMKVCSTGLPKPLRGLLVVVYNWENDILQTISNSNLDLMLLLLYPYLGEIL